MPDREVDRDADLSTESVALLQPRGGRWFDEALPPSRVLGFVLVWVALTLVTVDMVRDRTTRSEGVPVPVR